MADIVDLRRKERKPPLLPGCPPSVPSDTRLYDTLQKLMRDISDQQGAISDYLKGMTEQQTETIDLLNSINQCICAQPIGAQPVFGTYYNKPETPILVGTAFVPPFDRISNVPPGTPGYQREAVWDTLNRLSKRITIINDGTTDIFVIASNDGKAWSLEAPIRIGEARTFFDIYELRIRGPVAGDVNTAIGNLFSGGVYRITEYDYWLAYSAAAAPSTSTANRGAFTAQVVNAPLAGAFLPSIIVPNGFSLVVRANANNAVAEQIFVANSIANATTPGIPGNRITLNAGDATTLLVTNAGLVAVSSTTGAGNVDILVEQ